MRLPRPSLAAEVHRICQLPQATISNILPSSGDLQLPKNGQKTIRLGFESAFGGLYALDCAKTVHNVPDRNSRRCALDAASFCRSDTRLRWSGALAAGDFVLATFRNRDPVAVSLHGALYPLLLAMLLPLAGICSCSRPSCHLNLKQRDLGWTWSRRIFSGCAYFWASSPDVPSTSLIFFVANSFAGR